MCDGRYQIQPLNTDSPLASLPNLELQDIKFEFCQVDGILQTILEEINLMCLLHVTVNKTLVSLLVS